MATFDANSFGRPNLKDTGISGVQTQQAIGNLSARQAGSIGPQGASQLEAQQITAKGQEQVQQLSQSQQLEKSRGQVAVNRYATQQRAKMSKRQDQSRRLNLEARQRIAGMGRDLEQKLFQDRLQFEYDARGVKFSNERQLADFKRMVAKDDEEYQTFAQQMSQRSTEKRKLLQIANAKITQRLQQMTAGRMSEADFEQKKKLARAKAALEEKIKKEANAAKNRALIFQGVGTVAGAVAGSFIPGAGTVAGAAVGGALGTMAAGATEGMF